MDALTLTRAYQRYGAPTPRGQRPLSALAADGALVLSCYAGGFGRPHRDLLRYQDSISRNRAGARQAALLGERLRLAHDGSLPVRLVIVTPAQDPVQGTVGVRPDLVGKVVEFDGDAFTVDFSRVAEIVPKRKARSGR